MALSKAFWLCVAVLPLANSATIINDPFDLRHVPYTPVCAHACRLAIRSLPLECTPKGSATNTPPSCFASNEPYLTSLAYCMSTQCATVSFAKLSAFWTIYAIGTTSNEPAPQMSYKVALQKAGTPNVTAVEGQLLNKTSIVPAKSYELQWNGLASWNQAENNHSVAGLALLCAGIFLPILISALQFLPLPRSFVSRFKAYVVHPSAQDWQWLPWIRNTGRVTLTRGQLFLIICMLAVNVGAASAGHFARLNNNWALNDRHGKFFNCLADRFGVLALANFPLIFLSAGRNNMLLWLTSWSHTTFLILHRWIAYIATAEAIAHATIYLYTAVSEGKHAVWVKIPAWYTGIVSICALSLLVPLSLGPVRRRVYEIFLASHIGVSVAVLCGAFYHVFYLFTQRYEGYPLYVWVTAAIWVLDRFIRAVRIGTRGIKIAHITIIDDDYVRICIPSVKATGHAYLYFPTLTLRVWENHPFSATTAVLPPVTPIPIEHSGTQRVGLSVTSSVGEMKDGLTDVKDSLPSTPDTGHPPWSPKSTTRLFFSEKESPDSPKKSGITFYLRTMDGITKHLRNRMTLPVLVEGSYGTPPCLNKYPTLLCFAGGVGITAILAHLHAHSGKRAKLYWGSRSQALVDALGTEISRYEGAVVVGRRMDMAGILQREFAVLPETERVAVVVSGPKGMADDLRRAVCAIGRHRKGEIKFIDECFGW